jgi:type II secretory pathway pseudopilin PulG
MQRGFTYLTLLFFVAILAAGLSAVAVSWHTQQQRAREAELIWAGTEIRNAIALYYNRSPVIREYPKNLEDLLKDPRYGNMQRYLRQVYRDPMIGTNHWGIVEDPSGAIMGVYSLSKDKPIRKSGFAEDIKSFEEAKTYQDWKFVYSPQ